MTGRSKTIDEVPWADAELLGYSVDYDQIVIALDVPILGRRAEIVCRGHIGIQHLGFWDEVVVESIELHDQHDFQSQCQAEISARYPNGAPRTGQAERNLGKWRTLSLTFSDGSQLLVAASDYQVL